MCWKTRNGRRINVVYGLWATPLFNFLLINRNWGGILHLHFPTLTSILHLHKTFQPPHLGDQPHPKCNEQQQQVELFILDQGPNTMLPAGSLAIRITSGWASVPTVAMASSSPCKNPGPGTDGEGQRQEYTKTLSHLHHTQHVGLKPGPCGV